MISRSDVEHLASLARIKLSSEEAESFTREIDAILGYVGAIEKATAGAGAKNAGAHRNILREDVNPHESGAYSEALLAEAPTREGQYVKVKKIISYD